MPYIPQTNETGTGIRKQLVAWEGAFIARGIMVSSTDNDAITGSGSGMGVNVQGTVSAYGSAIVLGYDATGHFNEHVLVGETGYVASASLANAIYIGASDSVVENEGEIWGKGFGVRMDGMDAETTSKLINSGTIRGDIAAVNRTGVEDFLFVNTGRVLSANAETTSFNGFANGDDTILNSGSMVGGIYLDTGNDTYDGRKGLLDGLVEGGDGKDTILCGAADDRISGGEGRDVLFGGKGRDVFVFDAELDGKTNVDVIRDFKPKDDTFELTDYFPERAGATGHLTSKEFVANTTGRASEPYSRVIYETDTGNVYFDIDGRGGDDAVLFAKVDKNLDIDHRDFVIVDPVLPDRLEDPGLF